MRKLFVLSLFALALLTAGPASSLLAGQHSTITADGGNGGNYGKGGG
jgi:hypothetical protein